MELTSPPDLTAEQRKYILASLTEYLPNTTVWAFGSRAKWTSNPKSDLDLVAFAKPSQRTQVYLLQEQFEESNLPFRVDLLIWDELSTKFQNEIKQQFVVLKFHDPSERNSEWRETSIGEIAEIVGGGTPSTKIPEYFGGNIPWITPKDLSIRHERYIKQGKRNLSSQGLENSSAKLVPANSVLLTTRAPIGYVAIAKNELATNQGFRSLILRESYSHEFLYYWLCANTEELKRHASGSTFGELSGSTLKSIRLKIPPAPVQEFISNILGTLDDKIELNRRMNSTLEEVARTLFKSWFVDFDPVRAKMEGRDTGLPKRIGDLFPDRFVDSELGKIPDGWKIYYFGEIVDSLNRNINPSTLTNQTPYIGLEHMPRNSIALANWDTSEAVFSTKNRFNKGNILFGKLRPYFHKVGIAPVEGICSTDILVLCPRDPIWGAYSVAIASSRDFIDYASQLSTGTRMPRVSWTSLSNYPICLPPRKLIHHFNDSVDPLLRLIISNVLSCHELTSIRDVLLPELVTGNINV